MISTTDLLLIAAGLAVVLALLSILIGILGAQRGQRAIYYAMRRQAQERASKRYGFAFWCVSLAGVLFVLSRVLPSDGMTDEATPLQTAAPLEVASTAQDPVLSAQFITTPTVAAMSALLTAPLAVTNSVEAEAANPNPPPLPATPTLAAASAAPASTQVPAIPAEPTTAAGSTAVAPAAPGTLGIGPNQQLALRAIGTGWDASGALQGVSTEFPVGTKTIYIFFNFLDVPRGTLLRHTWLQDGKTVSFSSLTFNKLGQGTEAISWVPKGGFQPGLYEVRVNLGNVPQFVANFLVR